LIKTFLNPSIPIANGSGSSSSSSANGLPSTINKRIEGLKTAETNAKATFDTQIVEGKNKGYVFPYFKERDQLKKDLDAAQTNLETANQNVKELTEIKTRRKELVKKLKREKTAEDADKVYAVPPFRGKKVSASSNDEKQAAQQKDAFVSKYKYTRDFTIPTDPIIKKEDLDEIIVSIFKYLQNSTYSVQTLESIQGRLEAGSILGALGAPGALGKSSEESASAPGTTRSLSQKEALSESSEVQEDATKQRVDFDQIENVIIQRGIDFLTVYAPSLRKEYTGKISSAVKIEDIDRSLQETYKKLQASKSPAQRVDIDREYNSIRDNILKYQRLKLT
jgi:hypothetical protein